MRLVSCTNKRLMCVDVSLETWIKWGEAEFYRYQSFSGKSTIGALYKIFEETLADCLLEKFQLIKKTVV